AMILGLTGPPGVGKSTTIAALVTAIREQGQRVGVLAIDPSSPFSGGALLGDRVRMQQHALDGEVLIRSMATRGHLGGLAVAAPAALRVYDAAGCDLVIIETVGVGQAEVDIAGVADCTVMLMAPGAGDGIQAAKAGILEIADILVVNKSDREGAHAVVRQLREMIALGQRMDGDWKPPVLSLVATTGEGLSGVLAAIESFRNQAERTGRWQERRLLRARREVQSVLLEDLRRQASLDRGVEIEQLAIAVRDGKLDAYSAVKQLLTDSGAASPLLNDGVALVKSGSDEVQRT
ncbi:MAG TPA: methylmalonyl Co-A mutase-associated GTPase MeaB, partial [Gemmatimonadales bacterium]|nr:methylmalonyl Co-A mutase-associated GTPase MeaB [Gemmatimonadales bacterium]